MRNVPNTTGPVSYGETSWETGDTPEAATGKTYYQELVLQANTVPLMNIFRHYNIRVDAVRCIIVCPFKSHKGGREHTGSFKYFAETNSFHCYGCKTGGSWAHGCEFMAQMEGITRFEAAKKIIKLFGDDIDIDAAEDMFDGQDFNETLEIMLDFSNVVREFRQTYFDENSHSFIENICSVYDRHNLKRKLDNEALKSVVEQLKEEIISYKPCLMP